MPDDYTIGGGKSEFNSTISVQNRINYWFAMAQEAQKKSDYYDWYKCMVNVYMDLESDMHKDDKESSQKCLVELNKIILDNANKKNKSGMSFDYLLEQCRLLYILRTISDVFQPPFTREEFNTWA